jgi:hypothetical protein
VEAAAGAASIRFLRGLQSLEGTSAYYHDGCDLIVDEPVGGVWASDHFGLVADLEPA